MGYATYMMVRRGTKLSARQVFSRRIMIYGCFQSKFPLYWLMLVTIIGYTTVHLHFKGYELQSFFINKTSTGSSERELAYICPAKPSNLLRNIQLNVTISLEEAEKILGASVIQGGSSAPTECIARWRVAIIVPFKDRNNQLGPFLFHMHQFLEAQQLNYTIYVVQQEDKRLFNRAKLLNVGYNESLRDGPFDCYVFHDVDLLPENNRHLYHCSLMPRHLNVAASKSGHTHRLPYAKYYGGVNMMTLEHLRLVNGWSNKYWGWGGEDDDMRSRIAKHGLEVWRYPPSIARYTMMKHVKATVNPNRDKELKKYIRTDSEDGLNSLQYQLTAITRKPLFTLIRANLDIPPNTA